MKKLFTLCFLLSLIQLNIHAQCPYPYTGYLTIKVIRATDGLEDVTYVGFSPCSTDTFNTTYDANKNFGALNRPTLFTINSGQWMEDNIMNSVDSVPTVPMGLEPGGNAEFLMSFIIQYFDSTTYIYVQDSQQNNLMHNARSGNFFFFADSIENWNRFVIHFTPPAVVTTTPATCSAEGSIKITQPGAAYWNYELVDSGTTNVVASGKLNVSSPISLNVPGGAYKLLLADTTGYTCQKEIDVSGSATAVASFTPSSSSVCINSSVNFTNTSQNANTYSWSFGDGATSTSASPSHSYSSPGNYTVTLDITTSSGCSGSATQTIDVTSGLSVNLGDDTTLCTGDSLILNAAVSGGSYTWNTGATTSTLKVTSAGTYWVSVTSGSCTAHDTIAVAYTSPPVVHISPADTTICSPNTVVLNAATSGGSYHWQNNSTGATYTTSSTGTYSVTVTASGCSATASSQVTVNNPPSVNLGDDTTICSPNTVVLNAATSGGTYHWQNNSTNSTYTANTTGTYSVTVTANGCSNTSSVQVTVNNPPSVHISPADTTICSPNTVVLNAATLGGSYRWQNNSTGATYTTSSTGTYSVTVTASGCSATASSQVTVNNPPAVNLGNDTTICSPNTVVLNAATSVGTYHWQDNSTNGTYTANTTGTYSVTVTANGCSNTGSVEVTVNNPPSVHISPADTTICSPNTVVLNAATLGGTYHWQNNSTGATYTTSSTGTYSVTVTTSGCSATASSQVTVNNPPAVNLGDDTTICSPNTVILNAATSGGAYHWQDNSTNSTYTANSTGTYIVTVTANGCSNTGSVQVTVNNPPTVNIGPADTSVCSPNTVVLNAATLGGAYQWQDNSTNSTYTASSTGTYSVTVTANGCSGSATINVNIIQPPVVNLGSDTSICSSDSVILTATTSGGSYQWQDNSTSGIYIATSTGNYSVTVTVNGCSATGSRYVVAKPTPVVNLGNDTSVCSADTVILNATAPGAAYLWQDNSTNSTYTVTSTGNYSVTVSENGCSGYGSVHVDISAQLVVNLGGDTTICTPDSVVLLAKPSGAAYHWQDNTTSQTYIVTSSGNYDVTVSTNGCSGVGSIKVKVNTSPVDTITGNSSTICSGQIVSICSPDNFNSYSWNNGPGSACINTTQAGNYYVVVTDTNNCSAVSNTVTINPVSSPTVTISANQNATCSYDSATICPSGNFATYTWNTGPSTSCLHTSQAGTYYVNVADSNGCTAISNSVVITVNQPPVPTITSDTTRLCSSDTAHICVNQSYAAYLWSGTYDDTTQCIKAWQAGDYYVTVTDNNGCTAQSNHIGISVYQTSYIAISIAGDSLEAHNGVRYQWFYGDSALSGDTSSIYVTHSPGYYLVEVFDSNGCASLSDSIDFLNITNLAIAHLQVYPNPSPSNWQLSTDNNLIGAKFEIFDAAGKMVFQSEIESIHTNIAFDAAPGVYLMRINYNGNMLTQKLVKL